MIKKKVIILLITMAVIALIFTAGCTENKPTYIIGVDAALSPWEYIDNDGNPQGINIDLINMIAEDQGFNVEYNVPKDGLWQEALTSGEIDTEGTIIMTPERQEKYAFVEMPFEPSRYIVVARTDSGITLDDFYSGDVSIAVFENSAYEDWLKNNFGDKYQSMLADGKIIIKDTADELAFAVISHKADTALAGSMTLSSQLNNYQALKFVGYVGEPKHLGFVMRKDDKELYKKFSDGINNVKNTKEFNALIKKYNMQYKKDTYIVGVDDDNMPWTMIKSDGTYEGFDIDMMNYIAEQEGFNVEYKIETWGKNINAIVIGDLDMWASSMTITKEREAYVTFSDSYYETGITVGIRPDKSFTKADFDKAGSKITTFYGTSYVSWLQNYFGEDVYNKKVEKDEIILVVELDEAYDLMDAGTVDFLIFGEKQTDVQENMGELKPVYTDEDAEKFGIALSNGNIVLQGLLNDGIQKFESSGKKAELINKYNL